MLSRLVCRASRASRATRASTLTLTWNKAVQSTATFSTSTSTSRPALTILSEDEQALCDTVYDFAKSKVEPFIAQMDEQQNYIPSVIQDLFDQGLMGIEVPEQYGGLGLSFTQSCLAIQQLARIDPAVSLLADIQNTLVVTAFRKYANQSLQAKYLPLLATNTIGSFCLSEANSGSDAFAMQTRAVLDGNHYVINGSKLWISHAKLAGVYIVFANADPSKGYKGITAFIVDKGTPGVTIGKSENKLGMRASPTCEVHFEDVRVHKDQILGQLGQGYKIAIELLNEGRIGISAQMCGVAKGAFDIALPYVHERKQFGKSLAEFQMVQQSISRIAIDIEAAQLLMLNAARLRDGGHPFIKEACMAKVFAGEVAERASSQCIELFGGLGFTKDARVEKFFRDSKVGSIYEGTTFLQYQTIAKLLSQPFKK